MFHSIATLTLNPAFDLHCHCAGFATGRQNYAPDIQRYLGGKGINVSRALLAAGLDNVAVAVLGEENADAFLQLAQKEALSLHAIRVPGHIRENLTIHDPLGTETRLSFDVFSCTDAVLDRALAAIRPDAGTCVVFSGRLPNGLHKESVLRFLETIRQTGAFLAVDSNSLTLPELIRLSPSLIKPNEQELTELGYDGACETAVQEAALSLHQNGIEHVLITRGALPGYYAGREGLYRIEPPAVTPVSTIGAGDCTVAGWITGLHRGLDIAGSLTLAFAFGTAACRLEGTAAPTEQAVEEIAKQIRLQKL